VRTNRFRARFACAHIPDFISRRFCCNLHMLGAIYNEDARIASHAVPPHHAEAGP